MAASSLHVYGIPGGLAHRPGFVWNQGILRGQLAGAVGALGRTDRDLAQAVGALLGGGSLGSLGLLAQLGNLVHHLDDREQHERRDDEVDDGGQEVSASQTNLPLGGTVRHEAPALAPGGHKGQQRLDEVVGHAIDNAGERAADDHADSHVDHIAAQCKLLELSKELLHLETTSFSSSADFSTSV